MATHGQEKSKVDAIAKFGKKQITSLDEHSFSDLLAQVKVPNGISGLLFLLLIFSQASECMGLPCAGREQDSDMGSFSDNILKFELSGQEYENFSVVDLPGIFRSELSTLLPFFGTNTLQNLLQVRPAKRTWRTYVE